MRRLLTFWLPAVLPLVLTGLAAAAEFRSPRGFSLDCPEGWIVASDDMKADLRREMAVKFPALKSVDLDGLSAYVVEAREEGFAANLTVAISPSTFRVNAETMKGLARTVAQELQKNGIAESNATCALSKAAGRAAVSMLRDVQYRGVRPTFRQWQVVVPGKGRTFTVTCTADAAEFSAYEAVFARMIDSFRVDDPPPGSLFSDMPLSTKAYILGAIALAAVVVLRIARKARRGPPPLPRTDGPE